MYTLAMGYDNMHRIKSKSQHLTQDNVQFNGTLNTGYDLSYTYGTDTGKKFQLANVKDVNYRTEETPSESENVNNNHAYEYDANGNLVYVNTSRTKKDGVADEKTAERKLKWDEENRLLASDDNGFVTNYWYDANGNLVYVNTSRTKKDGMTDEKAAERKLKWDEENRLLASDDNGFVTNYWYDADGERTVKTSGESDQVYVNSEFAGGRTNTAKFSLYVSPYLVANQGGRYTKHIYIGSQRVVSKIGDFDSYGSDPRRIEYAGSETDGLSVDYKSKYAAQQQVIKDHYTFFDVPYNGTDNNNYADGEGFCCNDGTLEAAQAKAMRKAQSRAVAKSFKDPDNYENLQFFYHPDHLGSSGFITNLDGEIVQHIEYVPFGEVFIEERNSVWNTPYLFNAKEFDEETGLYYYGARYYEPRLSIWLGTDPKQDKYPNIHSYCFSLNNPIKIIDPNGQDSYLIIWASQPDAYGHAAFGVDNYTWSTKEKKYVPDGTITVYGLFPISSYSPEQARHDERVRGLFLIDTKVTMKEMKTNNFNSGENSNPDGIIKISTNYQTDKRAKKALQNEIKLNKGYKGMSRNCSTFAREGVRAVSDKEIKGEESFLGKSYVTPNKLFEDTKMLPNTDVLVDPGQKTKYEFKSVIKAVIKHAMKP